MLFSCWQKDTTTRPYRPYRAVLLFSNTKRRVILRMRSDAFQSACDAASTKNKRMATQTNAVKSLSDEVVFSLSGSKYTISARFQNVQRVQIVAKSDKGCRNYRVKNHIALLKNDDGSKLPSFETNPRLALLISGPWVWVPGGAPNFERQIVRFGVLSLCRKAAAHFLHTVCTFARIRGFSAQGLHSLLSFA